MSQSDQREFEVQKHCLELMAEMHETTTRVESGDFTVDELEWLCKMAQDKVTQWRHYQLKKVNGEV